MRSPENPFRLPHSEAITSDLLFLKLFSPNVLDSGAFSNQDFWKQFRVFRSAAGGGKTTLLRLFTPGCLSRLYEGRRSDELSDLYRKLRLLGVVNDQGPRMLGILLTGVAAYSSLEDLTVPEPVKLRLFNAMLDARIIMAMLYGVCEIAKLDPAVDLSRIRLLGSPLHGDSIPAGANGDVLFGWAQEIEKKVWTTLDSFSAPTMDGSIGHEAVQMFKLLNPENLLVDGQPVIDQCVVMIDESWRLSRRQQDSVKSMVTSYRPSIGVWLAERFEALDSVELFQGNQLIDRDHDPVVPLDTCWKTKKAFETVANKRARQSPIGVTSFNDVLGHGTESPTTTSNIESLKISIGKRMVQRAGGLRKYNAFLAMPLSDVSTWDQVVELRAREILLERDVRKSQLSFDIEGASGLEEKDVADLRAMAEFFVCDELGSPYYYGMDRLCDLAGKNVYQFMYLATELFEEVIHRDVTGEPTTLEPAAQQALIIEAAKRRYQDTLRVVPNRRRLYSFLTAFSDFAREHTFRASAPYGAVTGFAIQTRDHELLVKSRGAQQSGLYRELADLLATCLIHNIFHAETDRKQGKPGQTWTIFYLNRLLCSHFGLPLYYGGYRARELSELEKWMESGHTGSLEDSVLPFEV